MRNTFRAIREYLGTPVHRQLDLTNDEIQEEIQFHLASRIDEYHQQGMSVSDSRNAALRQFGDVNRVVKECWNESSARQLFVHRAHITLTAFLLLSTLFLACEMWRRSSALQLQESLLSQSPLKYSPAYDGDVAGLVVDELGKPLPRANVMVAVKWWPENGFRQQCYMRTTDANGAFSINDVFPADVDHEVQIAAIADGHLLTSQYISDPSQNLNSLAIRLPHSSTDFSLEFKSSSGRPIQGVSAFPHRRVEASGVGHTVYFQSADKIIQQTDNSGRLHFSHFSRGDRAVVYVRFPDEDWQQREIVVPEDKSVVVITQMDPSTKGG